MQAARPVVKGVTYRPADVVDFVVVGAGAAGGVVARELSRAGFSRRRARAGTVAHASATSSTTSSGRSAGSALTNDHERSPNTFRANDQESARSAAGRVLRPHGRRRHRALHGELLALSRSISSSESKRGTIAGSGFDDWPISYAELEPYYTKVEWEIGVSGLAGANPFDPPRSQAVSAAAAADQVVGRAARARRAEAGLASAFPRRWRLSRKPYRGRAACVHCGFCEGFGCEMRAKSSTLVDDDSRSRGDRPLRDSAEQLRAEGRDQQRRARHRRDVLRCATAREIIQRAKAVVLCANGAETPRLLLMSASNAVSRTGSRTRAAWSASNSCSTAARSRGGAVRARDQRLQGRRRLAHHPRFLRARIRSAASIGGGGIDLRLRPPAGRVRDGRSRPDRAEVGKRVQDAAAAVVHAVGLRVRAHDVAARGDQRDLARPDTCKDAWGLPAIRMTFTRASATI